MLDKEQDLEHIITAVQHQFQSALRQYIQQAGDNIPVHQIIQKLYANDIKVIMYGLADINKSIQCTLHDIRHFFHELCSLLQRSSDAQVVLSTLATIFHHLFAKNEDEIDFEEEQQRFFIICKDLSFHSSDEIAQLSFQIIKYFLIDQEQMHDSPKIVKLLQDEQYLWNQGMTLQKTHNAQLRLLKGEVILSIASFSQFSRVFQAYLQVFWNDLEKEKCNSKQVISSLILGFQREQICQIIDREIIARKLLVFGPEDLHENQKHFKIIALLTEKPQAANFIMTARFFEYVQKNIKMYERCSYNRVSLLSILSNCAISLPHTKTIIAHTQLIFTIHQDFFQPQPYGQYKMPVCQFWKQILARNSSFQVYKILKEMRIIAKLFSVVNSYLSHHLSQFQKQTGLQILLPLASFQSRWRLQEPLLDIFLKKIKSKVAAILISQQDYLSTFAINAQQILDNLPLSHEQMSKRSQNDLSFTQSRANIKQRANNIFLGSILNIRQKCWLIKSLQKEFSAKIKKTINLYQFPSNHKTNVHDNIDGHYPIVLIGIMKSKHTFACISQKPFLPSKVIRGRFSIVSFDNKCGTKFLLQDARYVEKYQSSLIFGESFAKISTDSNEITFSRQVLQRIFQIDESIAGLTKLQKYEIFKPVFQ